MYSLAKLGRDLYQVACDCGRHAKAGAADPALPRRRGWSAPDVWTFETLKPGRRRASAPASWAWTVSRLAVAAPVTMAVAHCQGLPQIGFLVGHMGESTCTAG